jgi:hypothetical protein
MTSKLILRVIIAIMGGYIQVFDRTAKSPFILIDTSRKV